MKVFDLSVDYNFSPNLIDNLYLVHKKFGTEFKIKSDNTIIPVRLEKVIIDTSKLSTFKLFYDMPHQTTELNPFMIYFLDPILSKINSNSYIANIHRTDSIRGSEIVMLVLEINRKLGVKKTFLNDGARIMCGTRFVNLSFFKLIEQGVTFYMKFGFDFEIISSDYFTTKFKNISELKKKLNELIAKIRKLKIRKIISEYEKTLAMLCELITTQSYDKLEIELSTWTPTIKPFITYYESNPHLDTMNLIYECKAVLDILHMSDKEFLYEYLIELFNNPIHCERYIILMNFLMFTDRYKISVGNKNVSRTYPQLFQYVNQIKENYMYVYDFTTNL